MGISERKEREKTAMRSKIIDAAWDMFLTEGYEQTSVRGIADKIEYSPATIYLYYKDKDELLYEVQRLAFEQLSAEFKNKATSNDPFERLGQILYTYAAFGRSHPALYDLMFILKDPMKTLKEGDSWDNSDDCFSFLFNCLYHCIEQKRIRFESLSTAGISVWAMTHGLISLDIRSRIKVMQMTPENINSSINESIAEYLDMIKA